MKPGFTARGFRSLFTSRYLRFCLVGLSGLLVDSTFLWILTAHGNWPIVPAKLLAAEIAVANNFLWNDLWTFTSESSVRSTYILEHRFLRYNIVNLTGILLSTILILAFRDTCGFPIRTANAAAVVLVSLWNFGSSRFWVWERKSSRHNSNNIQPNNNIA